MKTMETDMAAENGTRAHDALATNGAGDASGAGKADTSPLLRVSDLVKSYDGKENAIEGVNLSVDRGQFVSIIGKSGAGKSTFLRCVNKLITPTSGSVVFDGQDMARLRGGKLRRARRKVSMVFQHYNLVSRSTAVENVLQGRLGYKNSLAGALGLFSDEEKEKAVSMLEQVGLGDYVCTRVDQLSGGQKQRVGIARALVQEPLLILADEPIASLDPASSRTVMEHLRWAVDELGVAALVSLHQVEFAVEFSDRIIGIAGGTVRFDGPPDELDEATIREIYGMDAGESAGDADAQDAPEMGETGGADKDNDDAGASRANAAGAHEQEQA